MLKLVWRKGGLEISIGVASGESVENIQIRKEAGQTRLVCLLRCTQFAKNFSTWKNPFHDEKLRFVILSEMRAFRQQKRADSKEDFVKSKNIRK